jgi:hypothetical protein
MAGDQDHSIRGDRALSSGDEDRLGFREVAKRIAVSLVDHASEDGLVIGIEGAWGSGKSSLLFLIGDELGKLSKDQAPTVINFRPWLIGNRDALITSLFLELSRQLDHVALSAGEGRAPGALQRCRISTVRRSRRPPGLAPGRAPQDEVNLAERKYLMLRSAEGASRSTQSSDPAPVADASHHAGTARSPRGCRRFTPGRGSARDASD